MQPKSDYKIFQPSEHETQLALKAHNQFSKGQYQACSDTLSQLSKIREDLRVSMNHFIADYYKLDLNLTDELLLFMQNLALRLKAENSPDRVIEKSFPVCVLNEAIIRFHCRQFSQALRLLLKLLPYKEHIKPPTFRRVLYLLIDNYIHTMQPLKALEIVESLEKSGGRGEETKGRPNEEEKQMRLLLTEFKSKCNLILFNFLHIKKNNHSLSNNSKNFRLLKAEEEFLKINFEKSINFLTINNNNNNIYNNNHLLLYDINNISNNKTSTTSNNNKNIDHKTNIQNIDEIYNSMCRHNNIAANYFNLNKFHLALHYLQKAYNINNDSFLNKSQEDPSSISGVPIVSLLMNNELELVYNLGILLLHTGRPHEAFHCLLHASQMYPHNPRLWLRLAESVVSIHKQKRCSERFGRDVQSVVDHWFQPPHQNKAVLIRPLIEEENEEEDEDEDEDEDEKEEEKTEEENGKKKKKGKKGEEGKFQKEDKGIPKMIFAYQCLSNALICINKIIKNHNKNINNNKIEKDSDLIIQMFPSGPVSIHEVYNLRCSILVLKSYVSLYLKNYSVALETTDSLLSCQSLSPLHKYLGTMYKSEALVAMERAPQSVHLLTKFIENNKKTKSTNLDNLPDNYINSLEFLEEDNSNWKKKFIENLKKQKIHSNGVWFPWKEEQASILLIFNLAVSYASCQKFQEARFLLNKCLLELEPPHPLPFHFLNLLLQQIKNPKKLRENKE